MAARSLSTAEITRLLHDSFKRVEEDMAREGKFTPLMFPTQIYAQEVVQEEQEQALVAIEDGKDFRYFAFILTSLEARAFPKDCKMPNIAAGATFSERTSLADALAMMFPTHKRALQQVRSAKAAIAHGIVCVRVRISEKNGLGRGKRYPVYFLRRDAELKPNREGNLPSDWLGNALFVAGTGKRSMNYA
eukprot:TRINITY_DN7178_c1_g1_i1.p1 TRINITY_DN7178_c1_g1~~TRINITY_DN7178_c1_g1_i1.p1  ORF type:complete len:190 (+),score=17.83 TRINITY_DN7178_c1_g1_i1:172-741(+)